MRYMVIAATFVLAGKAGLIDMGAALALGSGVAGVYLGAYAVVWHVTRCCTCAEHLVRGIGTLHESGCQPHGTHRHHESGDPPLRPRAG